MTTTDPPAGESHPTRIQADAPRRSQSRAARTGLRFTQVHLENWRNFTMVDADLQQRVFLVGPNGSGKSNFLDVFRFLRDIVAIGGGFQQAVLIRGGGERLHSLSARRNSGVAIHVWIGRDQACAEWEYELCFHNDQLQNPIIARERVLRRGKVLVDRPDDQDENDSARLTQTYLEQVHANSQFRDVAEFFGSVSYHHIVPQIVREPDRSIGKTKDPFGGDFLEEVLRTPGRTRQARLRRIEAAISIAVPQLRELRVERDARGAPHLVASFDHWSNQGAWLSEIHLSDGTLRLLGLLWSVLTGEGPLLMEEPELGLHSDVVRQLPQLFARIGRKASRQIILSTHAVELLVDSGIGLDEVLVLQPRADGTTIHRAGDFAQIRLLLEGGLNLSDAVVPYTRPERVWRLPIAVE